MNETIILLKNIKMPSSRGKETSLNYLFYQETTNVTPLERVHQIGRNLNESFFNIFSKDSTGQEGYLWNFLSWKKKLT